MGHLGVDVYLLRIMVAGIMPLMPVITRRWGALPLHEQAKHASVQRCTATAAVGLEGHISDITGKTLHRSRVVMDAPMPRNPGRLTTTLSESGERAPACDPAFVQVADQAAM